MIKSGPTVTKEVAQLEQRLGHAFATPDLLRHALIHASSRKDRLNSNERLEFLGDRVLGLSIAALLYERFPDETEGDLGYRFTALVRREALALVAAEINLAECIVLSGGEAGAGGRKNPSILADCCEAVIGAIFLDAGFVAAEAFVKRYWTNQIDNQPGPQKDAKTLLQELCQKQGLPLPQYEVQSRSGPDHLPIFTVQVLVDGRNAVTGDGKSKQEAEQAAAEKMLKTWQEDTPSQKGATE